MELTPERALTYAISGLVRALLDAGWKRDAIAEMFNFALHNELAADARTMASKELLAEHHDFSVATLNRNSDREWIEGEAEQRLRRALFRVYADRKFPMTAREAAEKLLDGKRGFVRSDVADAVVLAESLARQGFLTKIPRQDEAPLFVVRGGGSYDVDWGVLETFDLAGHMRDAALSFFRAIVNEVEEVTSPAFEARLAAHRAGRGDPSWRSADWPKPAFARALYVNEDVPADVDTAALMERLKAELRQVAHTHGTEDGPTRSLRLAIAMHFSR